MMKVIYIVTGTEIIPEVIDSDIPANDLLDNLIERHGINFIGYTYSRPEAVELFEMNVKLSLDELNVYYKNIAYLERCLSLD